MRSLPRPGPTRVAACAVALAAALAWAAADAAGPSVRSEIDALLARLAVSGCAFGRNGSWYDAAEARSHLLRKFAWLDERNLVPSTEQFIDRGASASSTSGRPYLVRCGNAEPVESRTWLSEELRKLRASSPSRPSTGR